MSHDEGSKRVNPLPTADEVEAYLSRTGERILTPEVEQAVCELLAAYPDLARALTAPFPEEGAGPSEPGYVSNEEMTRLLAELRARIDKDQCE